MRHFQGKGQSAIEYLMTYGWMLLVVAIVGGAVFSLTQGQNLESVSGFSGSDLTIDNFGVSESGGTSLVLRNMNSEEIEIKNIVLQQGNSEIVTNVNGDLGVADSTPVDILGVVQSDSSNSINVEIEYSSGSLSDQIVSGSISGNIALNAEEAAPGENWAFVDISEVPDRTVKTKNMGDLYIMEYEASAESNISEPPISAEPVSRENHVPWRDINQEDAIDVCSSAGYELPTNREWQAATMAEIGNSSTQPLGNNNGGQAIEDSSSGTTFGTGAVLTGSGPDSWSNQLGIYDLNGNLWEMTSTTADQSDPVHLGSNSNNPVESWDAGVYPASVGSENSSLGNDAYWSSPQDGRVIFRGGGHQSGDSSGAFSMSLLSNDQFSNDRIGFRCSASGGISK